MSANRTSLVRGKAIGVICIKAVTNDDSKRGRFNKQTAQGIIGKGCEENKMPQQQEQLPKLLPAPPDPGKPKNVTGFHFCDAQMREMARIWHINHPEFVIGILTQTGVIKETTPEKQAEAKHYIKEATEIGFFSKADITQYTIACMNAGGSIAHVWTFKEVLVQFTEDTRDVMAQIINAAPVHYWTYLPGKVKKYDRGL